MHAYASSQPRTSGYAAIAVVAVIISIAANGVAERAGFPPSWLISAPAVATSFGLLYKFFDRWAWRWRTFSRFSLGEIPDIEGTYEGNLVSTYDGTTVPVRVCVDQTWVNIAIRFDVLGNATSTSRSLTAGLDRTGHTQARLTYTYRNTIRPGIAEHDMNDHDGTAELHFAVDTGMVEGRYYNFRGRQGTLSLRRL
jgi:hypothetical protein